MRICPVILAYALISILSPFQAFSADPPTMLLKNPAESRIYLSLGATVPFEGMLFSVPEAADLIARSEACQHEIRLARGEERKLALAELEALERMEANDDWEQAELNPDILAQDLVIANVWANPLVWYTIGFLSAIVLVSTSAIIVDAVN